MIPEQPFIDLIALNVVQAWLLMMGFTPSNGWDSDDPNCVRDCGPHRIYTIVGKASPDMADSLDLDALKESLSNYLKRHNKAPTAAKFQPYDIEAYYCPCGCGTFLYVTIYN
ncbi:MAG: hypothetical protein VB064_08255 [Oscillospiraceae bacterium]|nr:hypothetical protein [Oscillospiraceae bacterium]